MRVFGYIRVSGNGQIDGDGPLRQRDAIASFCQRFALKRDCNFFDAGVSGTVDGLSREQVARMIAIMASNPQSPKAVVVERMDRLARDLIVQELLLKTLREQGIKVFCVDQNNLDDMASNDGDPTRVLIRQMLGALSQWEKSAIVKKLRTARDRSRAKSGKCEGRKPYGYRPGEKEVLDVIKLLWNGNAGMTFNQLAIDLNSMGLKTRCGGRWCKQRVHQIVKQLKSKGQL